MVFFVYLSFEFARELIVLQFLQNFVGSRPTPAFIQCVIPFGIFLAFVGFCFGITALTSASTRNNMISFGLYFRFDLASHFPTGHAQLDGVGHLGFGFVYESERGVGAPVTAGKTHLHVLFWAAAFAPYLLLRLGFSERCCDHLSHRAPCPQADMSVLD